MAGDLRSAGGERRAVGHGHDRQQFGQGAPLGSGRKRGEYVQAIGRSRGGRTTKIHLLTDEQGLPHVLQLTVGQASDIVAAFGLIATARPAQRLLADRAYDGDALRRTLAEQGTTPVIPNKRTRVNRFPFDDAAYRPRNVVERTFCRLKDFRAVATRYDKLARNFLAGVCLIAALCFSTK